MLYRRERRGEHPISLGDPIAVATVCQSQCADRLAQDAAGQRRNRHDYRCCGNA